MDLQSRLIDIYLTVCKCWEQGIWTVTQRHSNNQNYAISDQEVVTIYLFGISTGHSTKASIFEYIQSHFAHWFPALGKYDSFSYRLNQISDSFISLASSLIIGLEKKLDYNQNRLLVDSLPIIMANNKRSSNAKVAPEYSDKGYWGVLLI